MPASTDSSRIVVIFKRCVGGSEKLYLLMWFVEILIGSCEGMVSFSGVTPV